MTWSIVESAGLGIFNLGNLTLDNFNLSKLIVILGIPWVISTQGNPTMGKPGINIYPC